MGLILGLGGLGLAGYLYYLLVYLSPEADLDNRVTQIESRVLDRGQEINALQSDQQSALARFAEDQRLEREASAERLLEAVNQLASQAPPSRREWKVAEVAYLLRIANHRLLMERDVEGAEQLLVAADAILTELDDFSLYQVRAELADEILALRGVESNDVQGLFLRLEAVKTELKGPSLRLPRLGTSQPEPQPADAGLWASLVHELGGYLRFRRFDGDSVKPLLAPEEAVYLELNLRLMLERAQLAALRREQIVYRQSLDTALEWLVTYLDDEQQRWSVGELEALAAIELDQPLPDISGSLVALQSLGEM
jgi:uroporphyrin-3 C-methyltransferase